MSEPFHRLIDVVLIVLGAFGALHLNLDPVALGRAHEVDPSLVAFVAALALSVFPACGTYAPPQGRLRVISAASRTAFAWLIVQLCGLALLYAIHREHHLSMQWFGYWTLVTGISLLASHTLVLAGLGSVRAPGLQAGLQSGLRFLPTGAAPLDGDAVLDARERRLAIVARHRLKRTFDIVVGIALLVALSPALALLALCVVSDGGPAVFAHERVGRNGRTFRCLKFRTMVVNADDALRRLLETDPDARAEWERCFKLKNDVRVTRVGRFLRRTSLDELPQLWNVIRGEMSLVGPRPVVDEELVRYGAELRYYLMATPGMTGLWQVSGRSGTDYSTRVSLDVEYVKHWSMHRDLVILVKTFLVVVRGVGAY